MPGTPLEGILDMPFMPRIEDPFMGVKKVSASYSELKSE
jgi:hypothetical protein